MSRWNHLGIAYELVTFDIRSTLNENSKIYICRFKIYKDKFVFSNVKFLNPETILNISLDAKMIVSFSKFDKNTRTF